MSKNLIELGFITEEQAISVEKRLLEQACIVCHGVSVNCEHCDGSGFEKGFDAAEAFIEHIVSLLSDEHKTTAAKRGISTIISEE